MDDLRLILLGLGALVIAGVYALGRWRARAPSPDREEIAPRRAEVFSHIPSMDRDELEALARDIRIDARPGAAKAAPTVDMEKILVLHVMFRGTRAPVGGVTEVLEGEGLRFGRYRIYHREIEQRVVYSVANMVEPGTLEPDADADATTPGVSLFLVLPGPEDGVDAFAHMLASARRLAEQLGGEVLDGNRSALSRQTAHHIREEILEFQRRLRTRAGAN